MPPDNILKIWSRYAAEVHSAWPLSLDALNVPSELSAEDSIDMLGLPARLENGLKRWDIFTVGQLLSYSIPALYKIKNFGPKSIGYLIEVRKRIEKILGIELENAQQITMRAIKPGSANLWYESLGVLNLPPKIITILRKKHIITVGDLYSCPKKKLIKIRGLGIASVHLLNEKIRSLNITTISSVLDKTDSITNNNTDFHTIKNTQRPIQLTDIHQIPKEQFIDTLLALCGNPRLLEVIKRRYGLINGERETLEEIGESYSLTRERIRQLQKNALRKMQRIGSTVKQPLIEIIETIIEQNNWIISDEEADKMLPGILKVSSLDGSAILDLISDLGWIQSYSLGDVILYSQKVNFPNLENITDDIFRILKRNRNGVSVENITKQITLPFTIQNPDFIAQDFINKYCLLDPRIVRGENLSVSSKKDEKKGNFFSCYSTGHGMTQTWTTLISQVLEEAGSPLHFTEIANKVNDHIINSSRYLDHRRAHALLINCNKFAHTGIRGTYGLTKWGLRKDSTVDLIEESLMKAGFPLHWKQIYNYVNKYKNSKTSNIISLLENNGRFEKKGNRVYGLKESNH